jgi:hypothetical protein
MKTKTALGVSIVLCALCAWTPAQGVIAGCGDLMTLCLDGAYPTAPGEYTCACGQPAALTLTFSPEMTDYALLAAAWVNPEVMPWEILAVAPVPAWGYQSFTVTPPQAMGGCSFFLLAVGLTSADALIILPPVVINIM